MKEFMWVMCFTYIVQENQTASKTSKSETITRQEDLFQQTYSKNTIVKVFLTVTKICVVPSNNFLTRIFGFSQK